MLRFSKAVKHEGWSPSGGRKEKSERELASKGEEECKEKSETNWSED